MPTAMLSKSYFIHVPKTGGNWVSKALVAAGISYRELLEPTYTGSWAPWGHADIKDLSHGQLFRFAFVRNPTDWWRSFWAYRMRTQWNDQHEIDSRCRSDNFHEFVERVIENLPGYVSKMYERFVGLKDDEIDFIGRYENLVDDFIEALNRAGETFEESLVRGFQKKKVNATRYEDHPAKFTPAIYRALRESEREAINRFGF